YAAQAGLTLGEELGFGVHGIVFAVHGQAEFDLSALKLHYQEAAYLRERDVYLRLQELNINEIRSCQIPQLLRWDDDLLAINMTIVERPYILDFGGAFLDSAPDFSEEVLADWRAEKIEQFGSRWPEADAILRLLETHGIFVIDVNPNNITLP